MDCKQIIEHMFYGLRVDKKHNFLIKFHLHKIEKIKPFFIEIVWRYFKRVWTLDTIKKYKYCAKTYDGPCVQKKKATYKFTKKKLVKKWHWLNTKESFAFCNRLSLGSFEFESCTGIFVKAHFNSLSLGK